MSDEQPAEYPSEEDLLYKEVAKESIRKSAGFLSDTLRHFVTLNATLLGGSVALLSPEIVHPAVRVGVAVVFLASLACGLYGLLPYHGAVNPEDPQATKAYKEASLAHKNRWLQIAACVLLGGFALAVVGMGVQQVCLLLKAAGQ